MSYRQTSNISHTLVGSKIADHSDVVGAWPAGTAPTTSSFSTLPQLHLHSRLNIWLQGIGQDGVRNFCVLWWGVPYIRDLTVLSCVGPHPFGQYNIDMASSVPVYYLIILFMLTLHSPSHWLQSNKWRKWPGDGVNSSPPSATYVSVNRISTGSDNGLSPIRRQAII